MATERITIITELVDKASGKLKKIQEVTRDFNRAQGTMVDTTSRLNNRTGAMERTIKKTTSGVRSFNFAWLSVMFAGMAIYRVFGGIIKQQLKLWGLMEGFSAMITVVMLPVMEMLSDILWPIIDLFMNLPEPIQKAIGMFILLAAGIGLIFLIVGQVMLAVQGFMAIWPIIGTVASAAGAAITASLGLILGIVAIVVAIVIGMYLAWKENFLGMKAVVQFFIDGVKQFFGGFLQMIKGIMNVVKGIFTGDFDLVKQGIIQIFMGLWNFLVGGFKMAMGAVGAIIIGTLRIVYGFIKVIIDGLGWILGKAGKLLGGSGKAVWKMPSFKTGGVMPQDGLAMLHKGEVITPANKVNNTNNSPNITINANVASDIDIRTLADKLKKYLGSDFEKTTTRGLS